MSTEQATHPEENLFRTLCPGMVKHTRFLLVDYDICRYHSFDQLRWQLMVDSRDHQFEHFSSIRQDLRPLLQGSIDWADQVRFAQQHIDRLNVYDVFTKQPPDGDVTTRIKYERKLREMMSETPQKITPTDVNDRFGIVFDRSDITGYMVRYKADTNVPAFIDQVKVFELNHVLNMRSIADIVKRHMINAIMISSSEFALQLATLLINSGYREPITFIIGRYAYNYFKDPESGKLHPLFNNEMGELEIGFKYEFGFFEPFTGLAYKARLEHQMKQTEETTNGR